MRPNSRQSRLAQRGLTRFELLLYLGLTSAVVGCATLFFGAAEDDTKQGEAVKTAKRLLGAASDFKRTKPELGCPTVSLLIHEHRYERTEPADDPWGGRFRISCSEQDVRVQSAGKDGQFSTADDIAVNAGWNS